MRETRPLWQLLALAAQEAQPLQLSCEEAFLLLEYLGELAATTHVPERLWRAIREHFACCPECREYHLARLQQLERLLARRAA